ncbi:MAG: hypothetical protein ACYC3X_11200 [Pirellulaceae bacterium]
MSDPGQLLSTYLHLAAASQRRRRPHVRDRFLLLAGVVAIEMQLDPVAAYCRKLVLQHNPQHLVRRWSSLRQAVDDEEFLCFLKQLRRRYPQEKAEQLLQSLDIDVESERRAYYSDYEYAAALLGTTPAALELGESGS